MNQEQFFIYIRGFLIGFMFAPLIYYPIAGFSELFGVDVKTTMLLYFFFVLSAMIFLTGIEHYLRKK